MPIPNSVRRAIASTLAGALLTGLSWGIAAPARAADPPGVSFEVDSRLHPSVRTVEPVGRTTGTREIGVLEVPDAGPAELVLDEVMVHTADQQGLDAFVQRWDGQVLDSYDADADGQDHLVRVNVAKADPAQLPADLLATEPRQRGTYRAGDERVLRLLALAASEWKAGTEVVVNWLVEPTGIAQGQVFEAPDINKNVFEWSYMRAGGDMDTGVAPAWQLLQAKGKLQPTLKYMVVDGGFSPNNDFPNEFSIHKGSWGDSNPHGCSNNSSCPWHGTDVSMTGAGRVDNGYGTAGSGGPVVKKLVAVGNGLDYWTVLRRTEKAAEDEHPDVVNMSFTRDVHLGVAHARKWTDRRMQHVAATGALMVAAAGNDGKTVDSDTLFVPCESKHVMCVGGMNTDATRAAGSNFGLVDNQTSVEIYGPMCVRVLADPGHSLEMATKNGCGTSFASPFVGGVAALVKAANPALTAPQIRQILNETAHVGGLGADVTGSQRRVDALAAVGKALNVPIGAPKVVIDKPTPNQQVSSGATVDLWGTATDFKGAAVPITWTSDKAGVLSHESKTAVGPLAPGTHVITASATDSTGKIGTSKVTITVTDAPPTAKISSPPAGIKVVEGEAVNLAGVSFDPDTFQSVPDNQAKWEVKRNNVLVFNAVGHKATLPASKVTPGSYSVKFTAGPTSATRTFTVVAGAGKPTATITTPTKDLWVQSLGGVPLKFDFGGTAHDPQDGTLTGDRYRWTAYSPGGTKKVLCEGSAVPKSGGNDQIVLPKNCATATGELGVLFDEGLDATTWTVWLEAFDSGGLVGTDSVTVTVVFNVH
ncbi:S8 family serine peptidase [Dactylosporangium sp. NPDC051541]|uniref:S8 family peptidase n=1 Tax=Dactylosporangium sp. NPDC051541 TaxID=3363977 RepID=UPI0037AAB110